MKRILTETVLLTSLVDELSILDLYHKIDVAKLLKTNRQGNIGHTHPKSLEEKREKKRQSGTSRLEAALISIARSS